VTYLVHEIPTGTNINHFRHSRDGEDGLCPSCCAMGLVRLPAFATSGGRSKPPGINHKPPIYVIPFGESLADTLRLLWREVPDTDMGTPAWEKPELELPNEGRVPLLTGLTWLPRRVWLADLEESDAPCISCSRRTHLIKECIFDGVGSQQNKKYVWRDPHVIYPKTEPILPKNALKSTDAAAGQWAYILEGLLNDKRWDNRIRSLNERKAGVHFWIVGFSTAQNDQYLEATESVFPLAMLREPQPAREKLRKWTKGCRKFLEKPFSKYMPPHEKSPLPEVIVSALRPYVEDRAHMKADQLLSDDRNARDETAAEYASILRTAARSLCPGFTAGAVERREKIAAMTPDILLRPEHDKSAREKQGGDK